jgi:PTS system N-acetylglucosamine-specific IIC component
MRLSLSALQPLGRALMLPIAVLPIAGLLLRLGQDDLLGVPFIAAAGQAVFAHLGLLFAVGVAVGFARDSNGAAGLAGVVCYLVAVEGAKTLLTVPPETAAGLTGASADLAAAAFRDKALARFEVPVGIVSGLIAGDFYNRFATLKLPEYLAFFGGRRFIPIVSGVAGLVLALVVGLSWTTLDQAVDALSRGVVASGEAGLFVYGVLNRVLIVTGLHHILNNIAWFIVGDHHGATGDLNRFFAGDPSAGAFMTGFFPVMMFGLPAACLAMYHAAKPDRRKAVGGMLASLALTTFLTGVTEPIEFSFMFLAPALYAVHAVLTGVAFIVMSVLDVRLGFTFSAGLFDYVINFGRSENPWLLLPVGAAYFVLYYGLFRWVIQRFDLKTPGRESEAVTSLAGSAPAPSGTRAEGFIAALGGAANIRAVGACTTRLRLVMDKREGVDETALKALGARGTIWPSAHDLQVVLGPVADAVADEMRARLSLGAAPAQHASPVATSSAGADAAPLVAALGGSANLAEAKRCGARVLVRLKDQGRVDESALKAAGVRAIAPTALGVHLLFAPGDGPLEDALEAAAKP